MVAGVEAAGQREQGRRLRRVELDRGAVVVDEGQVGHGRHAIATIPAPSTVAAVRAVIAPGDGSLVVGDRPIPEPGPGEVRIRVHAAGLNRADLLQRAGLYPAPPGVPADIPGLEFAGEVDAVGPGVTAPAPGAGVFGVTGGGGQAEYVVVPAGHCAPVPDSLDLVDAGGVPEVFVTAHDAMRTRARLATGEHVLVHAVGSGVGTAVVQLAKAFGATVTGTARTESKLD